MNSISNFEKIKSIIVFEIFISISLFLFLLFQLNEIGFYFFWIGICVLLIFSLITFIKNYFYRAFFILENKLYIKKMISFNNKFEEIEIIYFNKLLFFDIYRVKIRIKRKDKQEIRFFFTHFMNEEFVSSLPPNNESKTK